MERFNRTLGKSLQTAYAEGKCWKKEIHQFLLRYRTTPHCVTGVPPSTVLFNYEIKNGIPSMTKPQDRNLAETITAKDKQQKSKVKKYADRKSAVQSRGFSSC